MSSEEPTGPEPLQSPLPEPGPIRELDVTVTTEVRAVPGLITDIEVTPPEEPTEITPEPIHQPQPQYVSRLAGPTPAYRGRSRLEDKPSWVFWIRESRGVTTTYDILEWSVRVGFLALGVLIGWLIWHMH